MTPAHPETKGTIERFNLTLKDTLWKMVNNDVSAWEEHNHTHGSNPYHLLFGVEAKVDSSYQTESDRLENMQLAERTSYFTQIRGKQYRQQDRLIGNRQI